MSLPYHDEIRRFVSLRHIYNRLLDYFPGSIKHKSFSFLSRWVINEISFGGNSDPLIPTGEMSDDFVSSINSKNCRLGSSGFTHLTKAVVIRICCEGKLLYDKEFIYSHKFSHRDKTLEVIVTSPCDQKISMKMTQEIYNTLEKQGVNESTIVCLFLRYYSLFSQNLQLSIPPELSITLCKHLEIKGELFASFFNRHTQGIYCSLFPDLEVETGSLGNYFRYKIPSGIYFANPPFDILFMSKMAEKMVMDLNEVKELTYIITLPLFDPELKSIVEGKEFNYDGFECVDIMNASGFVNCQIVMTQNNFHYFHYLNKQIINPCSTHLIIMSNSKSSDSYRKTFTDVIRSMYEVHIVNNS
jgi:hypothetical protein